MKIDVKIKELDQKIFHPKRILLMSFLIALGSVSQGDLKKKCELTWGELTSHLKQLEKANYVTERQVPTIKGPRSIITVTQQGIKAYKLTLSQLKHFLENRDEI